MTTDIAAYPIEELATATPPGCEARIVDRSVPLGEVPCEFPAIHRVSYFCPCCEIRTIAALCERCTGLVGTVYATHPACGTPISEWTILH